MPPPFRRTCIERLQFVLHPLEKSYQVIDLENVYGRGNELVLPQWKGTRRKARRTSGRDWRFANLYLGAGEWVEIKDNNLYCR